MNEQTELQDRSPRYPGSDLETAINKATELYNKIGKNKSYSEIALEHMGYTRKSGQGRIVLSSMEKFGLVYYEGRGNERKIGLTDLALHIILDNRENSQEKKMAIKKSALMPETYSHIWEVFNKSMPADEDLRYYLLKDMDFTNTGADKFISLFKHTVLFAELEKDDKIGTDIEIDRTQTKQDVNTMQELNKEEDQQNLKLKSYQIPLENDRDAIINLPRPISMTDYNTINEWLKLMKNVLVKESKAKQLLDKLNNNDNK